MKDRTTGKSRGFGFVTFQRSSDAAHAGNKEHMVDGRRCEVRHFSAYPVSPSPSQSSSLPLKALWEFANWEAQVNNGHMSEVQNMVIHSLVVLLV